MELALVIDSTEEEDLILASVSDLGSDLLSNSRSHPRCSVDSFGTAQNCFLSG
jgi:hypothetical protein